MLLLGAAAALGASADHLPGDEPSTSLQAEDWTARKARLLRRALHASPGVSAKLKLAAYFGVQVDSAFLCGPQDVHDRLGENASRSLAIDQHEAALQAYPVLRHTDGPSVLRPPPGSRLLVFGSSHMRSVREVLVNAGIYGRYHNETEWVSNSNDCDEDGDGPGEERKCGLTHLPCPHRSADLIYDTFDGDARVVWVLNHRRYQIYDDAHADALDGLLDMFEARHGPFTGGIYAKAHDREWFDAQCRKDAEGTMPDPDEVGDKVEVPCDMTQESCRDGDKLFQVVAKHVPQNLMHTAVGLRALYAQEFTNLDLQFKASHLCVAVCRSTGTGPAWPLQVCELGPGTAYAAAVLQGATSANSDAAER